MIGKTNSLSGGDIKGETLKVSLRTNQSSHSDLNGVAFTLEYADLSERYVWEGSDIIIKIPPYLSYTITPEDVDGYKTPSVYSSTSIGGFQKTATFEYQCTIVTVKMDDNQPNYNDVATATATVSSSGATTKTVPNGGTAKVPTGNVCTITWGDVSGYKSPDSQTFTASGTSTTKSGVYQTEILTVNVVSDIAIPSGFTITVSGIGTQTTSSNIYKIPFGVSYTISASKVTGYTTPSSQSFTAGDLSRTVTMEYLEKIEYKDLSYCDIHGNTTSTQSTANCYVVKNTGNYMFPLVFGNAIKNGSYNPSSYTNNGGSNSHDFVDYNGTTITNPYIENVSGTASSAQLSIADTDGVFSEISIQSEESCRYVCFKINKAPTYGANGVISIKDGSGVIMWSWHIWVWKSSLTPIAITNSTGVTYNILPVNLGTLSENTSNTKLMNWYYQFGRPTPLLCASGYNTTSKHSSYGELSLISTSVASDIQQGIRNPTTYYKYSADSEYNWFLLNCSKNYNLWDASCTSTGASDNNVVKTVYDPCPVGFKMPNGNIFTYFSTSTVVGSFSYGHKFKRNSSDTTGVFFPATGYYTGSAHGLNGEQGFVWTSANYSSASGYMLKFSKTSVSNKYSRSKYYPYSVRPVEE